MMMKPALRPPLRAPLGGPLALSEGVGYTPEALALFARFTTPPTNARKALINNLIVALIAAGVWSKMDALYVLAAADAQAAQRNWVADTFNLTPQSAPTFEADRGYTGNGSTSYLESSFNPTTAVSPKFTQNSATMFLWSLTNLNNAGGASSEIGSANSRMGRFASVSGQAFGRPNTSASINAMIAGSFPGLSAWSRSAGALWESYANGVDAGGGTDASAALTNGTFRVGMVENIGFGVNQNAIAGWGSNLSVGENAALYAAAGNYLWGVGAIAGGPF